MVLPYIHTKWRIYNQNVYIAMPCRIRLQRTFTSSQVSVEARSSGVLLYKKDQSSFNLARDTAEVHKSLIYVKYCFLEVGFLGGDIWVIEWDRGGFVVWKMSMSIGEADRQTGVQTDRCTDNLLRSGRLNLVWSSTHWSGLVWSGLLGSTVVWCGLV